MRKPALILAVLAATLLMAPASPQDKVNPPRKDKAEESAKKVKELQKERIATLKQMVEVISDLFRHNRAEFDEAIQARLMLLKAELDAAEKESERITLYKNIVDVLKDFEKIADRRYKASRVSLYPVLKVKAMRIEAEIDLERAKAKEAEGAK